VALTHSLRAVIAAVAVLTLAVFARSVYLARSVLTEAADEAAASAPPVWHFALYLPDNRNSFFTGIIQGAERAAAEVDAAVSIHSIDPAKNELEMACYTGVDGVAVCPYLEDGLARRQLERLDARGIPVVLINHNIAAAQPWTFVGANSYDVGRRVGLLASRATPGAVRLLVVYSDKSPGLYNEREIVEMGVTAALDTRLAGPIVTARTGLGPLDAEALLYRLIRARPDVNTIVFTDPNDTIAAAQTLVDVNLVGWAQVIGFGDDAAIQEDIRKGVVFASVVMNPERMGYEALRSLAALRGTGYSSTAIDTGLEIIDRERF